MHDDAVCRLALALIRQPGAVPVLMTLFQAGGSASLGMLTGFTGRRDTGEAARWLTANRLVKPHGGRGGSRDGEDPAMEYELTAVGHALAGSLQEVTAALAAPVGHRVRRCRRQLSAPSG